MTCQITNKTNPKKPYLIYNMEYLSKKLQHGYQLTNPTTFPQALKVFREILLAVPLINVHTKSEQAEVDKLLNHCHQYIIMIQADMLKKSTENLSKQRELELNLIMA